MDTIGDILLYVFYGATLAAAVFFVHKVLWLVQYKRIQRRIIDDAVRALRAGKAADVKEWEEFARSCWSNALDLADISGPSTFIRRVEQGLTRLRADLRDNRRSIEELLADSLAAGARAAGRRPLATPAQAAKEAGGDADTTEPDPPTPGERVSSTQTMLAGAVAGPISPDDGGPERAEVLSIRRVTKRGGDERYEVSIDVSVPPVAAPRPPDRRLYELTVRSRYGMFRRALVFFSGVADVVYSSHHVALMSQNSHVPTSVLVRRLSLVFLVIAVVVVDFTFGARRHITEIIDLFIHGPPVLLGIHGVRPESGGFLSENAGTALGFAVWAGIYGSIYLTLYFAIRRRYQVNVRRLRELRSGEDAAMKAIYDKHLAELAAWGREYGRSLDAAVEITVRHAETLVDHYAHRLRRRIAGPALIEGSKTIADCLFLKLPESRGELQDASTTHKHSLAHYVWPREEEMAYQVRIAQYRAAWQHLELAVGDLRKEQPDPNQAHALWRSAWVYAMTFSHLVPAGLADELRQAYAQMVAECVAQTDRDLGELDRRLGELHKGLSDQLDSARPLVESRVELTNSHIQATVAARSAEIIRVREQARLEAMAFEI